MLCVMRGLVTFLKACAVTSVTLMGIVLTNWKRADLPDQYNTFSVVLGFALIVGAFIAFLVWFRRRSGTGQS